MGAAMGHEHLEVGHSEHKLEEEHGLMVPVSGALINHPTRTPVATLRETTGEGKYKNQYRGIDTKLSTFYEIFCQRSPDHDFPEPL